MTHRNTICSMMGFCLLLCLSPGSACAQVTQEWVVQYDSTNGLYDIVADIALDGQENLLLTGWSVNSMGLGCRFLTLKYSDAGEFLWASTYSVPDGNNQAAAVESDLEGNVYVGGMASLDYTLIKYDSDGQQLWVTHSFLGESDGVTDMAIDASGNIYLTGGLANGFGTVKYSPDGQELWTAQYCSGIGWEYPTAMDIDDDANVYVTGTSSGGFFTIKYDADGQQLWTALFEGWENQTSVANDIEVDSLGFVFIAGSSIIEWDNNWDFVAIKYSPEGAQEWVATSGLFSTQDAYFLALDDAGNCYVTGIGYTDFSGPDPIWSFLTAKYNDAGQEQWLQYYLAGEPRALETDVGGNVYVAGTCYVDGVGFLMSAVKYNAAGTQSWSVFYGPYGTDLIECVDFVLGSNGDFFMAGTRWHPPPPQDDRDIVAIKYHDATVEASTPAVSQPKKFCLYPPFPNPFNLSVSLSFSLPKSSNVTIKIYNTEGKLVRTCLDNLLPAGLHRINFDGSSLSTGLYICRLQADDFSAATKLLLLK